MPAALGAFLLPSLGGTIWAGVVGGAIIGAGIGALTSAVTGGDIFKGALFGAVGGAVLGAASFGIDKVFTGMNISGGAGQSVLAGAQQGTSAGLPSFGMQTGAQVAKEGTKSGFLSKVGGWLGKEGGAALGAQAVSAGIGGIADMYTQKKQAEATSALQDKAHAQNLEVMEKQHGYNMAALAAKGGSGGGGGGASGPDYTIDELIRRDTSAAENERTTVLAKVSAELDAQRALKNMDLAESTAYRERAAAAGGALKSSKRTGSRSDQSLTDVANQGRPEPGQDPDVGVDVGVDYVPNPIRPLEEGYA